MDTINLKTAKLQGYVYDHLEIDEHGAARDLTQELLKKFDSTIQTAYRRSSWTNDTVSVWAIFVESRPTVTSEPRSKRKVINEIAKRHNGVAFIHSASGANSYSLEENDQIYKERVSGSHELAFVNGSAFLSFFWGFSIQEPYGKINSLNF